MRWIFTLIGALLVVGATGAGTRHALQPPLTLFLVPGATDIQVVELGAGTWQLTYHTPGRHCDWYATVTRTLAAHHWKAWSTEGDHTSEAEPAPTTRASPARRTYTRMVKFRLGYRWDQAVLDPDPRAQWWEAHAPAQCHRAHAALAPD